MRKIYFTIVLLLFPISAFSAPELKGSAEELRRYLLDERSIITISGSGEEKVKAETTVVSLIVKTREDKFQTALDKNIKIRKEIKSRLIAGGIPEEKIEIAKYSSTPTYSWLKDKPSSYETSNQIMVTIEKEQQLLLIADIVDTVKEVFFLRTDLKHTKKQEFSTKALEKVLNEVNSKKQLYEKTLGVALSLVRIIDQSINEGVPVNFYQQSNKSYISTPSSMTIAPSEFESGEDSPGFGEIIYRAQTQAEFIVNQKRQ
jgi:uncharacterized protein YggE